VPAQGYLGHLGETILPNPFFKTALTPPVKPFVELKQKKTLLACL
jgi:hypothetical protein